MTNMIGVGSGSIQGGNTVDKSDAVKTPVSRASETSTKPTLTAKDAASLSGVGSLLAASASTDDVRAGKVAALREAVNNGTYNVPAADLADKLLNSMLK